MRVIVKSRRNVLKYSKRGWLPPAETRLRVERYDDDFWLELRDAEDRLLIKYHIRYDEALDLVIDLLEELQTHYEEVDSDELARRVGKALAILTGSTE